jgi:hypothetical protein
MHAYISVLVALSIAVSLGSRLSTARALSELKADGPKPYISKHETNAAATVVALGVALALVMILIGLAGLAQPARAAPNKAKTAESFIQSIGVDTHIKNLSSPYGDYQRVKRYLNELGVMHARDAAVLPKNTTTYSRYADLCASLGIRYILNVTDELWSRPPTASEIDQIVSKSGCAVEAFEGPNEFNLERTGDWGAQLETFQRETFNAINASSHPEIPLLASPLGKTTDGYPPLSEIPNLADESDANSMHSYPQGNHPTGAHPRYPRHYSFLFDRDIPMSEYVGAPGRDIYATETGYHTSTSVQGISEQAYGLYAPRLSFEYFNAGVERGYHYQLLDHLNEGPSHPQSHFGLIAYDGRKKSAYRALENTIDILEDPGGSAGFTPGSLEYTLSGGDENVHTTLLQKRDGTFYLALWQEVRSFDRVRDTMIDVPAQKVKLEFAQRHDIAVFDPTYIASSGQTDDAENHPKRIANRTLWETIRVKDRVKIVRISD